MNFDNLKEEMVSKAADNGIEEYDAHADPTESKSVVLNLTMCIPDDEELSGHERTFNIV